MSRRSSWCSLVYLAAFCPLALVAAGEPGAGPDWPRFRGPNGDGISRDTGLLQDWPKDGPPLLWKSDPVGAGYASVAVAGARLFTMGDVGGKEGTCHVFALDRQTGKKLWSAPVGKAGGGGGYQGPRGTPTVDGQLVYALGQFGDLVCLETATGAEKWRKNFAKDFDGNAGGWSYTESPLIDGDKLVCTPGSQKNKKGAIVALDKRTGSVIWEADFSETAGYASMVVSEACGVRQYVQLLSGGVASVSAETGKLLWRFRDQEGKRAYFAGNTANIPNPVVLGDFIFAGAGYGRGAGLMKLVASGAGPREEWIYFDKDLNSRHGGYVVVGDHVYADRDNAGEPFCANWKTGAIEWKRSGKYLGRGGSVSIVYADHRLYMRYDNGYIALVEASPEGYHEHGIFKIPGSTSNSWSHPVVVGGKLYLREKDVVLCYDVKAR
jgi:outer membrane protein assembly factor BamB